MKRVCVVLAAAALVACSGKVGPLPCGHDGECGTGEVCGAGGKCQDAQGCPAGQTLCGDGPANAIRPHACYDVAASAAHCGGCGKACTAPANATATCAASTCGFACNAPAQLDADQKCTLPIPTNLVVVSVDDTTVALTWNAVAGADGYQITRTGGAGAATRTSSAPALSDSGLAPGTAYTYRVRATRSGNDGLTSIASAPAAASTVASAPLVTVSATETTRVTLTWPAAPGADGYEVQRAAAAAGPFTAIAQGVTALTFRDENLSAGTPYYYRVVGTTQGRPGIASTPAGAITEIDAPVLMLVEPAETSIKLTWLPSAGATQYEVFRSENGVDFGSAPVAITGQTTATDGNLPIGTSHWYKIVAVGLKRSFNAAETGLVNTLIATPQPLTPGTVTTTSVQLTWQPVAGAAGYQVFVATAQGAFGAPLPSSTGGSPTVAGQSASTYTVAGLPPGVKRYFQVTAWTPATQSPGAQANAVTGLAAPASLTLTPTTTTVALSWTAVEGPASLEYKVERSTDGVSYAPAASVTSASTYGDSSLTPGRKYWYRVRAASVDLPGGGPNASNFTITLLSTPVGFSAPGAGLFYDRVQLSWTAVDGATDYALERTGDGGGTWDALGSTTLTDVTDNTVESGRAYLYRVKATTPVQASSFATLASPVTPPVNAPTGLTLGSATGDGVPLSWTAAAFAGGTPAAYDVERSTSAQGGFAVVGSAAGNATSFTDTTMDGATRYYYQVKTRGASASSGASNQVNLLTPLATPSPLGGGTTEASAATGFTVTWPAVRGASGFNLERSTDGVTFAPASGTTPSAQASAICANGTCTFTDAATDDATVWYRAQSYAVAEGSPRTSAFSTPLAQRARAPVPTGLSIEGAGASWIAVAWAALPTTSSYYSFEVFRATAASGPYSFVGEAFETRFVDTNLSPSTAYHYKVRASYLYRKSALSTSLSGSTTAVVGSPPTGLSANLVGPGAVSLTWSGTAPTYMLIRSDNSGVTWTQVADALSTASFTDTGVMADTVATYRVLGRGAAESLPGTSASVYVPAMPLPPTMSAAPSANVMRVTWTPPAPNLVYQLFVSTDGRNWSVKGTVQGTTCSTSCQYDDTAVIGGTRYYYRLIVANETFSTNSVFTRAASALMPFAGPPATPTITSASNNADLQLTWTAVNGASGYVVQRGDYVGGTCANRVSLVPTASAPTVPASSTSFIDMTAGRNKTVCYRVGAWSTSLPPTLDSDFSTIASTTTNGNAVPTGFNVQQVTPSSVKLGWTAVTGATGYTIFRSSDGVSYAAVGTTSGVNSTSFTDVVSPGGLTNGVTYSYGVGTIITASNKGSMSAPLSVTMPPIAPANLVAAGGGTQVTLQWSAATGAVGYTILRSTSPGGAGSGTPIDAGLRTSWTDTGLSSGSTYYYAVVTRGASQNSAASAEVSATTGAGGVTGVQNAIYVTYQNSAFASTTVPQDLSAATIAARWQQGATWMTASGLGSFDGKFTIANVPAGAYWLTVSATLVNPVSTDHFRTSARAVDLSFARAGRPDVEMAQINPTNYKMTFSSLQPWTYGDILETYSVGAGQNVFGLQGGPGTPKPGDTSLTDLIANTYQQNSLRQPVGGLVDGNGKQDDLIVFQLSTTLKRDTVTARDLPVRALSRAVVYAKAPVTQVSGEDTPFNGQFASYTPCPSCRVEGKVKRSAFYDHLSAVHPQATTFDDLFPTSKNDGMYIDAVPAGAQYGLYPQIGMPDVLVMELPPVETQLDVSLGTLTFGNPYPTTWPLWGALFVSPTVPLTLPGSRTPFLPTTAQMYVQDELASFAALASSPAGLTPQVTPPTALTINGLSATVERAGVGLTPLIAWSAPAVGTPSFYRVSISKGTRIGPTSNAISSRFARFSTTDTQVRIPPGVITADANTWYWVHVAAAIEDRDISTTPYRIGLKSHGASALTSKFAP